MNETIITTIALDQKETTIVPEQVCISMSISKEPVVSISTEQHIIPFKSHDGVFSNLNAKPEVMKIEPIGEHIDKPPSYSQAALNMPPTYQDALDDLTIIEGMHIGKSNNNNYYLPMILILHIYF